MLAEPMSAPNDLPGQLYRLAYLRGLTSEEAGNLVALHFGLPSVGMETAWRWQEVAALLFLRWRIDHADDVEDTR